MADKLIFLETLIDIYIHTDKLTNFFMMNDFNYRWTPQPHPLSMMPFSAASPEKS